MLRGVRPMSEDRVYEVEGLPALSSKDNFSFEISDLNHSFNQSLLNMNSGKDPRFFAFLIKAIHTIPDPKWRAETMEQIDKLFADVPYYSEDGIILCAIAWGKVTDWVQKTRGSITYNLVGEE